jgi:VWFA-related protein
MARGRRRGRSMLGVKEIVMLSYRVGGLVAAALSLAVTLPQRPAQTLEILEPKDGGWVSGEQLIKAEVRPSGEPAERVLFFVDGRLVCTVEARPFECAWNAGADVRSHDFRVVAVFPGGRRVPRTVRTSGVDHIDTGGAEMVLVTATVLDGDRLVQGLGKESFRVYEDDRLQTVKQFEAEKIPLELVVAIDNSDSMVLAIDRVKEYVKRFLSALRPDARVTLVVFNQYFFVLAPPSVDLAGRLKALDHVAPWGATSLHEAIVRSFDLLGNEQRRRSLVIFTDGDDTTSHIPRDAVERRSETSDAVLYMIGSGRAVISASLKDLCGRLALKSGGRAFFPREMDELDKAFDTILEEMSYQYLLTYPVPSTTRDATFHRIRVEVDGGYEVRTRQGYRLVAR